MVVKLLYTLWRRCHINYDKDVFLIVDTFRRQHSYMDWNGATAEPATATAAAKVSVIIKPIRNNFHFRSSAIFPNRHAKPPSTFPPSVQTLLFYL